MSIVLPFSSCTSSGFGSCTEVCTSPSLPSTEKKLKHYSFSEDEKVVFHNKKTIFLHSLALSNFRNYEYARLEVTPQPVVLVGENGAGKTNILEAISLLTMGRGLRRAKLSELNIINTPHNITTPHPNPPPQGGREQQPWAISANVNGRFGEVKIGTGLAADGGEDSDKRIVKIDGKIIKGQNELARHTAIIWLTPQMEQLFGEGASAGRKFLDRLVFSFDGDHAGRINEYEYAMRERNKLLQNSRYADGSWLDALEQTMAETATAIAAARLSTTEHINHTIASSTLSFPKALVDARGFVEDLLKSGSTALDAETAMKDALRAGRGADAVAGRTLTGTHRSEFAAIHLGKNMPAQHCSMGEQKAMMLSIILAQTRSGRQWHGVTPILLLDEVAGHLDANKRFELFEEICDTGAQAWMTGTDLSLFADLQGKAQFFEVAGGGVKVI